MMRIETHLPPLIMPGLDPGILSTVSMRRNTVLSLCDVSAAESGRITAGKSRLNAASEISVCHLPDHF